MHCIRSFIHACIHSFDNTIVCSRIHLLIFIFFGLHHRKKQKKKKIVIFFPVPSSTVTLSNATKRYDVSTARAPYRLIKTIKQLGRVEEAVLHWRRGMELRLRALGDDWDTSYAMMAGGGLQQTPPERVKPQQLVCFKLLITNS